MEKNSQKLLVSLTPAADKRLKDEAGRKGISAATLARLWINERLQEVAAS